MNEKDFKKLTAGGQHVDFFSTEMPVNVIAKTVCAFLNGSGGRIFLGIDKNGEILGGADSVSVLRRIESEMQKLISPLSLWTVEQQDYKNRNFVVVEVPEGMDKPYVVGGAIYYRRGAETATATRDEITSLIQRRAETSQRWERQLAMGADWEDLDEGLIRETAKMAVDADRWTGAPDDSEGFLHSLGLLAHGGVTNGALLLFGKKPSRWLPQARVRLLVLPEGKTGNVYSVDKTFDASLLTVAKEIPTVLAAYAGGVVSRFTDESWQRKDRSLYPAAALREGIMNALVHRDYSLSGSITISILPESLQISNPGGLPDKLTPADLKKDHPSLPRNPDIAHIFFLFGLIEKIGRGTQRIVEDCRKAHQRDPNWQTSSLQTKLTLFAAAIGNRLDELNDRQHMILDLLHEKKKLKASEIAVLLGSGITDRTVRSDLQVLVDGGWLLRRGRGRSTSYVEGASSN